MIYIIRQLSNEGWQEILELHTSEPTAQQRAEFLASQCGDIRYDFIITGHEANQKLDQRRMTVNGVFDEHQSEMLVGEYNGADYARVKA